MSDQDSTLTKVEGEVLCLLAKWEAHQFTIEQLAKGAGLSPETIEKVLSSLGKRNLVQLKTTYGDAESVSGLEKALRKNFFGEDAFFSV